MDISEKQACDILSRAFQSRGYPVQSNVLFHEGNVTFHADGWDPENRVGFEFLTSEADDHHDMSAQAYQELSARMQRGELFFFILDEVEADDEHGLFAEAMRFLDDVEKRLGRKQLTPSALAPTAAPTKASAKQAAPTGKTAPKKSAPPKKAAPNKPPKKKAPKKKSAPKKKAKKKSAPTKKAKKKSAPKKKAKKKSAPKKKAN